MTTLNLISILQNQLWAMAKDALDLFESALAAGPEAFSINSRDPEKIRLTVRDGIAIVPVKGGLAKDYGWFGFFSGFHAGYLGVREMVEKALADPQVKAILLAVDSPGGTVDGCKELVDFLIRAGGEKPLYAYADGQMTSAAYWIGTAAKEIAAPALADIGSIGVRTLHVDWSAYNEKFGVTVTHLSAGEYKALGNADEPLSEEATAYIKERLESTNTVFVDSVAQNRSLDPKQIRDTQAKVFLSAEALEIGLIDRIEENIDTFFHYIKTQEGINMDLATLKAQHPELYSQVKAEGAEEARADAEAATRAAVKDTADGIMALVKAVAGEETHEKLSGLVTAGVTAEQAEAMKGVFGTPESTEEDTEQSEKKRILTALQNAHSDGVPPGSAVAGEENPLLADAARRAKKEG